MQRKIRIGHTGITWPNDQLDAAIRTIGSLGYHGIELMGRAIERRDSEGRGIKPLLEEANLPYVASYCSAKILDPADRAGAAADCRHMAELTKGLGGSVVVLGGAAIDRRGFRLAESKRHVVESINTVARAISETGLTCCFHPHTGTPVETEAEIRTVMDSIDVEVVKFAPDVGQIARGGADPIGILRDYLELVKHVHLKDFIGGTLEHDEHGNEVDRSGFLDYTVVGTGVIDVEAMMEMLEKSGYGGYAMVELDGTHASPTWVGDGPLSPAEAATNAKRYLETLGYLFRP